MSFSLSLILKMIINGSSSFMIHKVLLMLYKIPIKWGKKTEILAPLVSITPDKSVDRRLTFIKL